MYDAIFTMCLYTFTFFWLKKSSVIVEKYQITFHVFVCAFPPEISSFFGESFPFLFPFFVIIMLLYYFIHWRYILRVSIYCDQNVMWIPLKLVYITVKYYRFRKQWAEKWSWPLSSRLWTQTSLTGTSLQAKEYGNTIIVTLFKFINAHQILNGIYHWKRSHINK